MHKTLHKLFVLFTLTALVAGAAYGATQPTVDAAADSTQMVWWVDSTNAGTTLTVGAPDGRVFRTEGAPGEALSFSVFDLDGAVLPDGLYTWELVATPKLSDAQRQAAAADRTSGRTPAHATEPAMGTFSIVDGALLWGDQTVEDRGDQKIAPATVEGDEPISVEYKQVISGDLTVYNSICVGQDCASAENYGSDTARMKENNTRIHFDDTSSSASFPNNDWRLVANDSTNGGANYFAVQDASANRDIAVFAAGADANALYVSATDGRIGNRTNSPVLNFHTKFGNSPGLRLEQDGSQGFSSRVWDIAANEVNFFVRDVSNSSALPFRIKAGAENDSLYLGSSKIGMFTDSPDSALHVRRTNGTAKIHVEEATGTQSTDARTLLQLTNNGKLDFRLTDSSRNNTWKFENDPNGFAISLDGTSTTEFAVLNNGNAILAGTLTQNSDVNSKQDFEQIDPRQILDTVLELPITTWSYIDDPGVRNIGPMAQDFYSSFGFGGTDKGIQSLNVSSVALAAIQGLDAEVKSTLETELEKKQQEIDELKERLAALEALLLTDAQ